MSALQRDTANMLDSALDYLGQGMPVFPVCSPAFGTHGHWDGSQKRDVPCSGDKIGKRPLVPWEALQTGLPTGDQVATWWGRWPEANIGMATGALSGIVVLDADSGDARKTAMAQGVPSTPCVWTGKPGGCHFHLKHPGQAVRNFARKLPGLDFRGDGGYVLLPPSLHYSGARYRWVEGTESFSHAAMPPWLHDLIRGSGPDSDQQDHSPLDLDLIQQGIPEGQRDDLLWRYACKLRDDNLPLGYADLLIRQAARLCRPPFEEALAVEKVARAYQDYAPATHLTAASAEPIEGEEENEAGWQFTVYEINDFMGMVFPKTDWLVGGFLKERGIAIDFGPPGSMKTILAAQLALCVATGRPFLGQFPVKQGKVCIIQEDTLESDFQSYLRSIWQAMGIEAHEIAGQLYIAPPQEVKLDRPSMVAQIGAWLDEHRPALTLMDAFYLLHDSDGMTSKDLRPILRAVKSFRIKYETSIWMLDHDRKSAKEANTEGNPVDKLYGGRAKSAAIDSLIESLPVKGDKEAVYIQVHKLRGARPPEPIRLRLVDGMLVPEGGSAESASGSTETVYIWLIREGGSRTKRQISAGTRLSPRSVVTAIGELEARGLAKEAHKTGREKTWIGLRQPSETNEGTYLND